MTENEATAIETSKSNEEELLSQSFWSLVWWKFKKNRLAMAGGIIVVTLYLVCFFFAEFFAPYLLEGETTYLEARPQVIRFKDSEGNFHLRPFVYGLEEEMDMVLRKRFYHENPEVMYPIHFFVKGDTYKWFGLISTNIHLFGTDPDDPLVPNHLRRSPFVMDRPAGPNFNHVFGGDLRHHIRILRRYCGYRDPKVGRIRGGFPRHPAFHRLSDSHSYYLATSNGLLHADIDPGIHPLERSGSPGERVDPLPA
jgi:hypothetical protein